MAQNGGTSRGGGKFDLVVWLVLAFIAWQLFDWLGPKPDPVPLTPEQRLSQAVDKYGEQVRVCGLPASTPTDDTWIICVQRFAPGYAEDSGDDGAEMPNGSGNR